MSRSVWGLAWQRGEGMHGKRGTYMARGECVAGGVQGGGRVLQERWPLQWTECILLECSCSTRFLPKTAWKWKKLDPPCEIAALPLPQITSDNN